MKRATLITLHDLYFLAVVALIQLLAWLRWPWLTDGAARSAALAASLLSWEKRRRIETNLSGRLAGRTSAADRRRIVRGVFYEAWLEIFSWAKLEAAGPQVELRGLEHLRRAHEAGQGAILWESNGFGQRLLAKRILKENGVALHQVHGPNNLGGLMGRDRHASRFQQTVLRRFFDEREARVAAGHIYLPRSDSLAFARQMVDLLKRNAVVCLAGDGPLGQRFAVADFLGEPASFATGAVSLARLSGAPLLPMICHREPSGHSVLTVLPPISVRRGPSVDGSAQAAVRQFAQLLGEYVRRYPEQYRNWHLLGVSPAPAELRHTVERASEARWTPL